MENIPNYYEMEGTDNILFGLLPFDKTTPDLILAKALLETNEHFNMGIENIKTRLLSKYENYSDEDKMLFNYLVHRYKMLSAPQ